MKYTITIKPVNGEELQVTGSNYKRVNNIHYLNGDSYPDSIVVSVTDETHENFREDCKIIISNLFNKNSLMTMEEKKECILSAAREVFKEGGLK